MTRLIPNVFPPPFVIGWFMLGCVLCCIPDVLARVAGLPPNPELANLRACYAGVSAIAYGVFRVFAFHPAMRMDYLRWLALTPWRPRMPLPMGSVHLVAWDALPIALLSLLCLGSADPSFVELSSMFMLAYLLAAGIAMAFTRAYCHAYVLAFGLGVAIIFFADEKTVTALALLVALCLVGRHGLEFSLAGFPWGEASNSSVPSKIQMLHDSFNLQKISDVNRSRVDGWPYSVLAPGAKIPSLSYSHGLTLSLLAAWYVYVFCSLRSENDRHLIVSIHFWMAIIVGPLTRCVIYCYDHWPPISFWGRIVTFRWIIPGYDRAFIAPLLACALGFGMRYLLDSCGVAGEIRVAVVVGVILLTLLNVGPTLKSWRLTGQHRLTAPWQRTELLRV